MTSVITPTTNTNQPEEKAISTITNGKTYTVTAETEINNRTKRARWAKSLTANAGVFKVTLGNITIPTDHDFRTEYHGAEVVFQPVMSKCAGEAGATWYITTAWLNEEMEVIGALLAHLGDGEVFMWEKYQDTADMPAWLTSNDGYAQRYYDIASHIYNAFCDGDQLGYFTAKTAERVKADAERAEHENRVALAYQAAEASGPNWHVGYVLEKAPKTTTTRDESRANVKSALASVEAAMTAELWEWVKASLGKLRCETTIRDQYGDPYGFVTVSEVAHQIMYRWAEDGFGDVERGIRNAVAREFVRRHLS